VGHPALICRIGERLMTETADAPFFAAAGPAAMFD
jgi:hypothetical protein